MKHNILKNLCKLVLEALTDKPNDVIKDMAINNLIDIKLLSKSSELGFTKQYELERDSLMKELATMNKPSIDEMKKWVDKIQTNKFLTYVYVNLNTKALYKLMPIKDYIKEVCCKRFGIIPDDLINDERYEFMKKNAAHIYNELQQTDTAQYNIETKDWIQAIEYINKGLSNNKITAKCNNDMRKKLAFYFIYQKLGFVDYVKELRNDILGYKFASTLYLSEGALKAYEEKYANLEIPEFIQDIMNDMIINAPKSNLAMFYKNEDYSLLPTALYNYLQANNDIISYKITDKNTLQLNIALETIYGWFTFIFQDLGKSKYYSHAYMCYLAPSDVYKQDTDIIGYKAYSLSDVINYIEKTFNKIKNKETL